MKLLRLKLENWRGVDAREIEFSMGVTLIEGPNEIGKSTIVEAIQTLFTVMDSSSKTHIKAIQPVGEDVGSSVEAEVEVDGCHFIYSKTYNKNKQTELRVLAPQPEQLTGREAHERVEQILEESVDMALWNALLVEQGNEIAGVTLSQSDGLARALDEAASGELLDEDDSDLFVRVQAEYEQYYTLKAGKPKFTALETELVATRMAVNTAKAAMADVGSDSDTHERCIAEIRRLEAEIPELQKEEQSHEASWQAIRKIKEMAASKNRELETAKQLLQAAGEDLERRKSLKISIDEDAQKLKETSDQLAQQAQNVAELKKSADSASVILNEVKGKFKHARIVADLARGDGQHFGNVTELDSATKKLSQLRDYNEKLAAARKSLQGVKIDSNGLEELRGTENVLQVALAKLDTVTSSIEISAESKLKLSLNDEELELTDGEAEQRDITAEMRVAIPGVVGIRIMPSQSTNELETETEECRESLERLLKKFGVGDLAEAVAVETKRTSDQQDAESWSEKIEELLGGQSEADWQAWVDDLEVRCNDYIAQRPAEPSMPANLDEAEKATAEAESTLAEYETAVEEQESVLEELRDAYNEANVQHRMAETDVSGQEKVVKQQQQELEKARSAEDDKAVEKKVVEKLTSVDALKDEMAALNDQLESASPEAVETLFSNARATRQRAASDLVTQQTQLAILEDRLTKAQADGRFETLETAEHKLAGVESEYNATVARAAAARRLWEVLNTHRDAARKAYVQPLKEGVEQLGKIVFGSGFSVEIGSDWGVLSRTQGGKTISFDDLSVGSKEQLGILMRLAAARIVSSQGGVPLIIDDALGFSDPSRLKTMGAAIASAGNDCQVILLTCTPGRFTHVGNAEVVRFL